MKRHDYIKHQATELKKLCDKRQRISDRYTSGDLSHKQTQRLSAELNFLGMEITKTEERLAFALYKLTPEQATSEFRPSAFHVYKGIRTELERTVFE